MKMPATTPSTTTKNDENELLSKKSSLLSINEYYKLMEALMIVTIAGFGGALAGLAMARRGSAFSLKKPNAKTRPFVDSELPTHWAVTCMSFASILELVKWVSPTSSLLVSKKSGDNELIDAAVTIGDNTIGGAVAGAIFRGSRIQTVAGKRIERATMPNVLLARKNIMGGITTGLALGFMSGCLQYSLRLSDRYVSTLQDEQIQKKLKENKEAAQSK